MPIFTLDSRYLNFSKATQIRNYQFEPLMERHGWTEYVTKGGQYIEDVSWVNYQDATLWWIIAAVNNLTLQVLDPLAGGLILRIPTQDVVNAVNIPDRRQI